MFKIIQYILFSFLYIIVNSDEIKDSLIRTILWSPLNVVGNYSLTNYTHNLVALHQSSLVETNTIGIRWKYIANSVGFNVLKEHERQARSWVKIGGGNKFVRQTKWMDQAWAEVAAYNLYVALGLSDFVNMVVGRQLTDPIDLSSNFKKKVENDFAKKQSAIICESSVSIDIPFLALAFQNEKSYSILRCILANSCSALNLENSISFKNIQRISTILIMDFLIDNRDRFHKKNWMVKKKKPNKNNIYLNLIHFFFC